MKKECIMSDEEKLVKRQKIERNRAKKDKFTDIGKEKHNGKDSVDYSDFEENSIPSITSITSESCFWESDKKCNSSNSCAIESVSPVTASSVPSPSSPLGNCVITSSKTVDVLKNSSDSLVTNFDNSGPCLSSNLTHDTSSHVNYNTHSKNNVQQEKKNGHQPILSNKITVNLSQADDTSPKFENFTSLSKTFNANMRKLNSDYCSNQSPIEAQIEESSSKKPDLPSQILHNSQLVDKLASNPDIIVKAFFNPAVISKLLSDPEIVSKLMSDPQISQLLKENILSQTSQKSDESDEKNNEKCLVKNESSKYMERTSADYGENYEDLTTTKFFRNNNARSFQSQIKNSEKLSEKINVTNQSSGEDVIENAERYY